MTTKAVIDRFEEDMAVLLLELSEDEAGPSSSEAGLSDSEAGPSSSEAGLQDGEVEPDFDLEVHLRRPTRRKLILPRQLLPQGAREGHWLEVEIGEDTTILRLKIDQRETLERRERISSKLAILRQGKHLQESKQLPAGKDRPDGENLPED